MAIDQDSKFNGVVQGWNLETYNKIKQRYLSLINSQWRSGDGFESLKYRLKYMYGDVDSISYKFNRYLIYVHKGVGRGRGINSGKTKPKPWLNPVLDEELPNLADRIAEIKAEVALKQIQIK